MWDKEQKIEYIIAKAIKSSDKSYFFENYTKQALSVVKAIENSGYLIIPNEPNKDMIKEGIKAVSIGKSKPQDLVKSIYQAMIRSRR